MCGLPEGTMARNIQSRAKIVTLDVASSRYVSKDIRNHPEVGGRGWKRRWCGCGGCGAALPFSFV